MCVHYFISYATVNTLHLYTLQLFWAVKSKRRARQVRVENHYFSTNTPRDHVLFRGRDGGLQGKSFFSLQDLNTVLSCFFFLFQAFSTFRIEDLSDFCVLFWTSLNKRTLLNVLEHWKLRLFVSFCVLLEEKTVSIIVKVRVCLVAVKRVLLSVVIFVMTLLFFMGKLKEEKYN